MRMEEGLDTGPVLLRAAMPIGDEATAGTLHDALAALGARLVVEALRGVAAGTLRAEPQPEAGVTYASKIAKEEARLGWTRPATELARAVRGFNPFPGAFFELGGERIRVLAARAEPGRGEPGTALDDALLVACGEGALRALVVQRAGRAAMDAADFLRGRAVPAGTRLS
jgi:methionyl-tRNA formyltransferase